MVGKENNKLDEVQDFFRKKGFTTNREVVPEECKNWEKPFRVDMIVHRDDVGYIAIEGKDWATYGSGSKTYDLIKQIKKYKPLTYFRDVKISKWCALVFTDKCSEIMTTFLSGFLPREGISLMEYRNYNQINMIIIDKGKPYKKEYTLEKATGIDAFMRS